MLQLINNSPRVLSVTAETITSPYVSVNCPHLMVQIAIRYEITDSSDDGISYVTITLDEVDTSDDGRMIVDTAISAHNNDHLSLRDQLRYMQCAVDHFFSAEGYAITNNLLVIGE